METVLPLWEPEGPGGPQTPCPSLSWAWTFSLAFTGHLVSARLAADKPSQPMRMRSSQTCLPLALSGAQAHALQPACPLLSPMLLSVRGVTWGKLPICSVLLFLNL